MASVGGTASSADAASGRFVLRLPPARHTEFRGDATATSDIDALLVLEA